MPGAWSRRPRIIRRARALSRELPGNAAERTYSPLPRLWPGLAALGLALVLGGIAGLSDVAAPGPTAGADEWMALVDLALPEEGDR
jgi:hypothetical protein